MISQKFSAVSEDHIVGFMNESDIQQKDNLILDCVESASDLWVLAKMKESYDEDNDIYSCHTDNASDEHSPL